MEERLFKRIFNKIKGNLMSRKKKKKSNEKFTIMIVPHNQKQVKNLHLPQWLIAASILVVLAIVSFSVVTITKYFYLSFKEKEYVTQNEKMISELESLIYNSDNLIKVQKNFSVSLNNLLKTAGLSNEISFKMGKGGALHKLDIKNAQKGEESDVFGASNSSLFSQVEEIKDLSKMEQEIGQINERIGKLSKKLKHFESVTRYIPSIWPLLGDGKIISQNNATMTISTLPFTPVIATANGKITSVRFDPEQKKISITILHKFQFLSVYSNLYNLEGNIKEGKTIKKGQIIGYVAKRSGKTAFDYSIYIGNKNGLFPVNPLHFTYLGR